MASFYFLLESGFQFLCQNNVWHLEADPGGQPGTDMEVTFSYVFMYVNTGLLGSG